MYCKFCGREISDNSMFCKYCGMKRLSSADSIVETRNNMMGNNRKPSKRKKIWVFIPILIVISVVVILWNKGLKGSDDITRPSELRRDDFVWNEIPSSIIDQQEQEMTNYIEDMKNHDSDIDGWTLYDKYEYGLNTADESDSDSDGLTDKEEIEVYGTNPLKCSTAEDLYSDGYKVQNGIDPFLQVEYEGDREIKDENGAITLYMKTPWDLSAKIIDVTAEYREEDSNLLAKLPEEFYYAYKVCAYDNDIIDIDLSYFANELNQRTDELDIETYALRENEYSKKRNGSVITVNYENVIPFDEGIGMKSYDIFIVDKTDNGDQIPFSTQIMNIEELPDMLFDINYSGIVSIIPDSDVGDLIEGYVERHGMDIKLGKMTHRNLFLLGSYEATEEEKNALLAAGEYLYYLNYGEKIHLYGDDISYFSKKEVKRRFENYAGSEKNGLCESLDSQFDGNWPKLNQWNGLFYYWTSNEYMNNDAVKEGVQNRNFEDHDPRFCIDDELSFKNPHSEVFASINKEGKIKGHGVCAGMAQIVAEVYNSDDHCLRYPKDLVVEKVTDYTGVEREVPASYDITKRESMRTFFNRYLYDFSLNNKEDEDEFMRMVSCYWARVNNNMANNTKVGAKGISLNARYGSELDWKTIENATEYLDNNQILLLSICIGNEYDRAHCVNLVSYKRGKDILDDGIEYETVTFDVYDSNYPGQYLRLICYRVPISNARSKVYYKYNTCGLNVQKDGYYASYIGQEYKYPQNRLYDYLSFATPKKESKTYCTFGLYNDYNQCLTVKL